MEGDKKFIIGKWTTPELEYLKDKEWVFTEKIDGTNIRIMWDGGSVKFAGRSDDAQLYWKLVNKLDEMFKTDEQKKMFIDVFGEEEQDTVLYGEGYGAKIQKGGGKYIKDDVSFVLFDVCINGIWLERHNVDDIAKKFGIKSVPIIGKGTLQDAIDMTQKGFNSQWGTFIAEGIVARPAVELLTRRRERIITKVKYKDLN